MAAETLPFRYLAVDGPIGVGKTVLVDKLVRRFEAVKVLEDVENPFLPDFYRDRPGAAFQTQMYFLLSRYKQQHEVVQQELFQRLVISDYTFQKDRIFAYLTLSDEELAIYDRLYTTLEPQVPVPDLVLYLTADVDTCMTRIRKRARSFEKEISDEYMARADRRLQPLLPLLQPLAAPGGRHPQPRLPRQQERLRRARPAAPAPDPRHRVLRPRPQALAEVRGRTSDRPSRRPAGSSGRHRRSVREGWRGPP